MTRRGGVTTPLHCIMIYVFVFLGEFGVELLNWQGVIRTFRKTLAAGDTIVCCSRASVYPIYEFCDAYIDIGAHPDFQASRSLAYFAVPPTAASGWDTLAARRFNRTLKERLQRFILDQMEDKGIRPAAGETPRFVFSSDYTILNGLTFGRRRRGIAGLGLATLLEKMRAWSVPDASPAGSSAADWLEQGKDGFLAQARRLPGLRGLDRSREASIYELPDLAANTYVRIQPDLALASAVQARLGWDLNEPFLLCQTRQRSIVRRSPETLPWPSIQMLLESLATRMRIVLITFHTGRQLDSYSDFGALPNFYAYTCRSFTEQAILIHFAAHCLFFTEGDFGSHIYVPPLMGRDVTVLAAASMYALPTAPIGFWNHQVFRFGGQILPRSVEDIFSSPQATEALRSDLLAAALAKPQGQPAASNSTRSN